MVSYVITIVITFQDVQKVTTEIARAVGTAKAVSLVAVVALAAFIAVYWASRATSVTYETFQRGFLRTEDPTMTVRPDGRIFFNAATSRLLKQSSVKTVRILWDRDKRGIALQSCQAGDKNAYSIAFPAGSRSPSLTAKSFMRYVGWSATRPQTMAVKWDEKNKMLEATLPPRFVRMGRQRTEPEADVG
jgi:hypothetical protein